MDRETRIANFLALAKAADEKAESTVALSAKEGWRKIAERYRDLARQAERGP
ncbi:MAG TPA: hypothetical protein VGM26_00870 [Rhizomicrobium sp.]|jgi:hypothetical protein